MKYNKNKNTQISITMKLQKANAITSDALSIFMVKRKRLLKVGLTTLPQARAALTEIEQQIQEQELGINTNLTL